MQHFSSTLLLGDIVTAFETDITQPIPSARFACCPIHAFSYEKSTAVGRFVGDIGLGNLTEFSQALNELLTEKVQKIILDFSQVTLSRTAIGKLVAFSAAVFGLDKRLYFYKPSPQVQEALNELEITKFYAFLATEDDIIATVVV